MCSKCLIKFVAFDTIGLYCWFQASEMACKTLQNDDLGEDEVQPAPKLLEVILQNCRGRVDNYLPHYIQASPCHTPTS